MAKSKKSKQRKLAAKRGKKRVKRKQALIKKRRSTLVGGVGDAARYPVFEALMPEDIYDQGIGVSILSRHLPDARIAVSTFLVDVFCLGVKDASARIMTMMEYRDLVDGVLTTHALKKVKPACVAKLVEESIEYARDLGFSPHRDYRKASKIFGDVNPDDCVLAFEFGKDGMPFYIAGPYDSQAKSKRIIDQLTKRLGPDGFEFLVGRDDF